MTKAEEFRPATDCIRELGHRLAENRPKISDMRTYVPDFYLNPDDNEHGLRHSMNTIIVADTIFTLQREKLILSGITEGEFIPRNRHVVLSAMGYHDSHHSTSLTDTHHGELAAEWILEHSGDPEKVQIAKLVKAHVPTDTRDISELLKVVKDADSLERVRAPKGSDWWLDIRYLRNDVSLDLIKPLVEINELEDKLLKEGFNSNGAELALTAFALSDWVEMK